MTSEQLKEHEAKARRAAAYVPQQRPTAGAVYGRR